MIKIFKCSKCGNILEYIEGLGGPLTCCNESMSLLVANTVDASYEKHIPEVTLKGNELLVKVGSIPHPMEAAHYISFICVETKQGSMRKALKAGDLPEAKFALTADDKAIAVYEYCNLHGLWKKEL